ncbi:MAG: AraC family transcriptional regulator ligand-binding domain-containing protein [Nitrospinaceae bacterium]|nr:AraC family transcriptional regulator [Gammaproteobacteria bacterium]
MTPAKEQSLFGLIPEDTEPSLSVSYVWLVFQIFGGDKVVERIFARHGLGPRQLSSMGSINIEFLPFAKAILDVIEEKDIPNMGLIMGSKFHLSTHGPMGIATFSSPNLKEALSAMRKYLSIRIGFLKFDVAEDSDDCTITLTTSHKIQDMDNIVSEVALLFLQNAIEFVLGQSIYQAHWEFAHQPPGYAKQYADFFSGTTTFNASRNALTIPASLLLNPCITANQRMLRIALDECDQQLAIMGKPNEQIRQIVNLMQTSLTGDYIPTEADIAQALNISTRTLMRQLRVHDTSYRALKNAVLKKEAIHKLGSTQMSVESIALQLGYKDVNNFRRAFKQWCGYTPSQFRTKIA